MYLHRTIAFAAATAASLIAASKSAGESPQLSSDPTELVGQLPTNSAVHYDEKLESRLAALGTAALPALKKELRLGIRFKELNQLLKAEKSRRCAVIRILARIPDAQSTELLVECLNDPPDNYGMRMEVLMALSKRTLSAEQIRAMLANKEPDVVLAGIEHTSEKLADPQLKAAVERIFDTKVATAQLVNEYGHSTASVDALWNVRFAAGEALETDMTSEIQARAKQILTELKQQSLHPTDPDVPEFISYASKGENIICRDLNKLAELGPPAKSIVEAEVDSAEGDYAKVLDMARARLGDQTRVAPVADSLVSADSHTVRVCAAVTLRIIGDRATIPALRKALDDPYRRRDGSDAGPPQLIFPVRVVAADALIDLGEDPKKIRATMRD